MQQACIITWVQILDYTSAEGVFWHTTPSLPTPLGQCQPTLSWQKRKKSTSFYTYFNAIPIFCRRQQERNFGLKSGDTNLVSVYVTFSQFPFKRTQRTQRKRLHCVRCVNENRKQRKRLIGCFDDWLLRLRSTIPIGWRLRSLRGKSYAMFFSCVIFLRLLRFLRTFYFACIFFLTQDLAFEWKPGFSQTNLQVIGHRTSASRGVPV